MIKDTNFHEIGVELHKAYRICTLIMLNQNVIPDF
jgi:hypothetical protein